MRSNRRTLLGGVGGLLTFQASNRVSLRPVGVLASPGGTPGATPGIGSRILLAYFSRAGENYFYGDTTVLKVGNTQVVAEMIASLIAVDTYGIEAADPYPDNYRATVERNVREQNEDARPAIANRLPAADRYDTVLLGSGIWNVRPPMIMRTFVESLDFAGKTIFPFTTYAVSGLGTTVRDYTELCPDATIGEALAVRGELATDAKPDVESWLRRIGLLQT